MPEISAWAHLSLGSLIILTGIIKLCRARGKPRGYALIWLGMPLIASTEVFASSIVYQPVEDALGPGWGMVLGHGLGIVGVGLGVSATYIITGRSRAARVRDATTTIAAFLLATLPWLIQTPAAAPGVISDRSVYYAANWQASLHWLALTVFLVSRVYGQLRIGLRRIVVLSEVGSLVAGIQIMIAAQSVIIVAISSALALQVAWMIGLGPELFVFLETTRSVLGALGVALLLTGVGWPYGYQRWRRLTAHRPGSRARRHLRLLHDHWSWMTAQMPEVSMFPEATTGRPATADDMQWQRTRLVTEIYDVHRRLAPHYDLDDHQRARDHVAASGLPPARAAAAVEHLCTFYALMRYRAGVRAVRVRRNFTTPSRTAETTAARIVRQLRLTRTAEAAAVIEAATKEEKSWPLPR